MSQAGVSSCDAGLFDLGMKLPVDYRVEKPKGGSTEWLIEFRCGCARWLSPTGVIRSPCVHLRAC